MQSLTRPGRRHHRSGPGHRPRRRQVLARGGRARGHRRRRATTGARAHRGRAARRRARRAAPTPSTSPTARRWRRWRTPSLAEHGRIDILVAVAGIYPSAPIGEHPSAEWGRVMDVNVLGALHAMQACLPTMRERGYGRDRADVVDHRADHRPGRVRALRRVEGGDARPDALGRGRAGDRGRDRERRDARQRAHRGLRDDRPRAPGPDAVGDPDEPARRAGGDRLGGARSSPRPRRPTSRARR